MLILLNFTRTQTVTDTLYVEADAETGTVVKAHITGNDVGKMHDIGTVGDLLHAFCDGDPVGKGSFERGGSFDRAGGCRDRHRAVHR